MNSQTLRDLPPAFVIPQGFFRYPKEWCSKDHPPDENLGIGDLGKAIADYLEPLTPIAQSVILELILTIFKNSAFIMMGKRKFDWGGFVNLAKSSHPRNPDLQEEALRLMQKVAGDVYQLSLADVKAIYFIARLKRHCIPGFLHIKLERQKCVDLRKQLDDDTEGLKRIENCGGDKEVYKAVGFRVLRAYNDVILDEFEEIEKSFS